MSTSNYHDTSLCVLCAMWLQDGFGSPLPNAGEGLGVRGIGVKLRNGKNPPKGTPDQGSEG
ncbi:MAG: hypothetical protein L0387_41115, partial [Acidobacteria bacterium]|nr:hypothetical protein [Acidobacteriota bacterium]